ncbi:hypothetical protein AAG570_010427 [Ranatra chinensis]|uniref:Uncharacterized protein n=1 Tax=Ranatra chinensis TaxID=642074 RepID=A0ABD0Z0N2_9HEMI
MASKRRNMQFAILLSGMVVEWKGRLGLGAVGLCLVWLLVGLHLALYKSALVLQSSSSVPPPTPPPPPPPMPPAPRPPQQPQASQRIHFPKTSRRLPQKFPSGDTLRLELYIDVLENRTTPQGGHEATASSTGEGAPGDGWLDTYQGAYGAEDFRLEGLNSVET